LLEGCNIEVDNSEEAVNREGMEAIAKSQMVTTKSELVPAHVRELEGKQHKHHFILRTPGRPYTFACNTLEQKIAWMVILKRAIESANKLLEE
jgi:hypothetical protein